MRDADLQDYTSFLNEFQSESDRGAALVGAAWLDEKLMQTLHAFMLKDKTTDELIVGGMSPLGAFSARAKAAFALGLISKHEFHEIDIVRKVRNEFAHRTHGTTFKDEKIQAFCGNLESNTPGPMDDPRSLFINAVVLLQLSLYYRPEYIKKSNRIRESWAVLAQHAMTQENKGKPHDLRNLAP